jgi:hypothetical protein
VRTPASSTWVHLIYRVPTWWFAGDVLFRQCTLVGWTGTYVMWFTCLYLLLELDPEVVVAGQRLVVWDRRGQRDARVSGVRAR